MCHEHAREHLQFPDTPLFWWGLPHKLRGDKKVTSLLRASGPSLLSDRGVPASSSWLPGIGGSPFSLMAGLLALAPNP